MAAGRTATTPKQHHPQKKTAMQATVKGFIDASLATDHTEAAEFLRAYS